MVESLFTTQLVFADKLQRPQPPQPQPAAVPSTSRTIKQPAKAQQMTARSHREPFHPQAPSQRQGYGPSQYRPRGSSHAATSSSRPSHSYSSYGGKATQNRQQGSSNPTCRNKTQPKKPPCNFKKGSSSY
ncbi:hypothetical protein Pcinc_032483 [Petrolisthes cinctipes]|uniref:Uncharacterized protein n=1 Tax=Petrolisthes cinctipes TaxID=88211 RepID=A0AAE1EUB7_PETCI|nr:hypothetical protein Pcinc_032483 [Petrolisthes cinctipes]